MTATLEKWIAELEAARSPPKAGPCRARTPVRRRWTWRATVCRRAERRVCALQEAGQLNNPEIIVYLNRLSDLLWLLARRAEAGRP